jgi:16S rRNA A1518/A1519 N6-dimethyltransferase RsmA/KsgA/DIM1 with predicted DNA glycosylase/AP lyase activity
VVSFQPKPVDGVLLRTAVASARALFRSRRKTLRNNLPALASQVRLPVSVLHEMFRSVGVDTGLRAEVIAPAAFLALAEGLLSRGGSVSDP